MPGDDFLEIKNHSPFQFFTVDSNLFMGALSLVYSVFSILVVKNKIDKVPKIIYILKYFATAAVTLTMLTVILFLAPISSYGYFSLFKNSNLFLHLLAPLLSIIVFIFFDEYNELTKKEVLLSISPTVIYGIYYVTNVATHYVDGEVELGYDWYSLGQLGPASLVISSIVMLFVTLGIGALLNLLKKRIITKEVDENGN